MLVAVSGRALALSSESDTSSCDHCSEKGATVSKAAPPIIPSIPSFFMIGLPDDIATDGGDAAHGPQRFAIRASCYLNPVLNREMGQGREALRSEAGLTHRPVSFQR